MMLQCSVNRKSIRNSSSRDQPCVGCKHTVQQQLSCRPTLPWFSGRVLSVSHSLSLPGSRACLSLLSVFILVSPHHRQQSVWSSRCRTELGTVSQRDVQTHHRTHHAEPRQHVVHWPTHTHTHSQKCPFNKNFKAPVQFSLSLK